MIGMSRTTGRALSGWALFVSLAQDALSTQRGSRQKRRDYGSRLPELLGKLNSDGVLMLAQVYAAETFTHPPNRLAAQFTARQIRAQRTGTGLRLWISGRWNGRDVQFEVPIDANGS